MEKPARTPTYLPDLWKTLQRDTQARIALGRTGVSVPSQVMLDFKLDHAHARDAVYSTLDRVELNASLERINCSVCLLQSKASSRTEYLQRPDQGRRLSVESHARLISICPTTPADVSIIIADGLSATAVNDHAVPVIERLICLFQKDEISISPITIVEQGRVAISDEIGYLLKSKVAIVFIGERPGLSSPDSLGVYLTYGPMVGLTDESRNCISNIRPKGLPLQQAADKIFYLVKESLRRKLSGVALKDNAGLLL